MTTTKNPQDMTMAELKRAERKEAAQAAKAFQRNSLQAQPAPYAAELRKRLGLPA